MNMHTNQYCLSDFLFTHYNKSHWCCWDCFFFQSSIIKSDYMLILIHCSHFHAFILKMKSHCPFIFIMWYSCSVAIDWICLKRFIISLLSDSLTTSWWRAHLASLWPGMEAPAFTSKWQRSTKAGLVACVETTMMTDQMISAAASVRQTSRNTLIVSISD